MKAFSSGNKFLSGKTKKAAYKIAALLFWISVWFGLSFFVGNKMIMVSPTDTAKRLGELVTESVFWISALNSFLRIMGGFFIALILGSAAAWAGAFFGFAKYLFDPLMAVIKASPVASFIILALFWFGSGELSVFTAFLVSVPVFYANIFQGIKEADKELLEMAEIFRISRARRIFYIYLPSIRPFFITASSVSLGMCWKSGVAAEVIGLTKNTVGEQLYYSKLYFDTAGVFAWTAVIILISFAFEKLFLRLIKNLLERAL